MKIAYWSPLTPAGTGIADYSEELLPYLAKEAELHLFVDDYEPTSPMILESFRWFPARKFEELREKENYDLNLYQIGNSSFHRYALNAALRFPGVVVLHDLVLQHLFLGFSVEKGDVALYVSEMKRAYGERGAALGRQIAAALGSELLTAKFPLSERLVERSYGVLVLTKFMQRWLQRRFGRIPVGKFIERAPHHYAPPPPLPVKTRDEARKLLGIDPGTFVVASFGLVTRAKRIDRALEGFRRFLGRGGDGIFLVVGEVQKSYPLAELVPMDDLKDKVTLTGRQPMDRFYLYMLAADVVVNLRFPSTGELSGTLIRTLGHGQAGDGLEHGSIRGVPGIHGGADRLRTAGGGGDRRNLDVALSRPSPSGGHGSFRPGARRSLLQAAGRGGRLHGFSQKGRGGQASGGARPAASLRPGGSRLGHHVDTFRHASRRDLRAGERA